MGTEWFEAVDGRLEARDAVRYLADVAASVAAACGENPGQQRPVGVVRRAARVPHLPGMEGYFAGFASYVATAPDVSDVAGIAGVRGQ